MQVIRVAPELLEDRLDAGYNAPTAVRTRERIRLSGLKTNRLKQLFSKIVCGPFGSTLTSDEHCPEGEINLVQPTNLSGGHFSLDKSWRIRRSDLEEKGLPLYDSGTFLFARAGVYPHVGVLPQYATPATISSSMIAAIGCRGIDPHYLDAFFKSKVGMPLLYAAQKQTAQPTIGTYELELTSVPVPDLLVQKFIGEKLRQAERLRNFASTSISFALASIEKMIERTITEREIEDRLLPNTSKIASARRPIENARHNRTPSASIVGRIDAWHYQPHLTTSYELIRNSGDCNLLHEIIDAERDIKGGATPLGADYLQSGVIRFYRTSDVFGLSVSLSGTAYITEQQDSELSRSKLQTGDVLLTITGADFGHAGVITSHHLPGNISQHSVRFRPTIDPDYLVAYLESFYGQQMLWRQAYGATRPAIDYPGVRCLLVRVPSPSVQKVIGDSVRAGINSRQFSIGMVAAAKSLVEALIERKVTEAEIIHAQTRLEQGDETADRAILSRLFEGGWDAKETRPLFPDLDAYYETLRIVERDQMKVAAK